MPQLALIEVDNDSLIEEGAPIPPEPKVGHWRPEQSVYHDLKLIILSITLDILCSSFSKMDLVLKPGFVNTSIEALIQVKMVILIPCLFVMQTLSDILYAERSNFHQKPGWEFRYITHQSAGFQYTRTEE